MRKILFVLSIAALSFSAHAQDLSYRYAGAALYTGDVYGADGDGIGLYGSFPINDAFFVRVDYRHLEASDSPAELDTIELGAGYRYPLSEKADLIAGIAYVAGENNQGDDDGFGLRVGARFLLTDKVELNGTLDYVSLEDDDTIITLGGRYSFTEMFSLGLSFYTADETDADVFGLDFRVNF